MIDRRKFVGGSDVASILGVSPWKTPFSLYQEKISTQDLIEQDNKILQRGKRMEPYVLQILCDETGLIVSKTNERYVDEKHSFMCCEIDAEAETGENIEIKTVSPYAAKEWGEQDTDSIPIYYAAQAMYGLMITEKDTCVFGALIGADDFRVYRVNRCEDTIKAIRARVLEFWDAVQSKRPPAPINLSDIASIFPSESGEIMEADTELFIDYQTLKKYKEQEKALQKEIEEAELRIKKAMGDASKLAYKNKILCTWKNAHTRRLDQKLLSTTYPEIAEQFKTISESRIFRVR